MLVIAAFLVILIASLGLLAFAVLAIVRLPTNYFIESESRLEKRVSLANKVLRNLLGVLIVTLGLIIMLPVFPLPPGSSVAIMLSGVAVMEFSGKKKILRRSALVPGVLPVMDWLRRRAGVQPLEKF